MKNRGVPIARPTERRMLPVINESNFACPQIRLNGLKENRMYNGGLPVGGDSDIIRQLLEMLGGESEKSVYEPKTDDEKEVYERLKVRYDHIYAHLENLRDAGLNALMMTQQEYLVALRGNDPEKAAAALKDYEEIKEAWNNGLKHIGVLVNTVADVGSPEPGHIEVGSSVTANRHITKSMLMQWNESSAPNVIIEQGSVGVVKEIEQDNDLPLYVDWGTAGDGLWWVKAEWID